jgi:hypothetical protein
LTTPTKTPLAMAWARWMVRHASCCGPELGFLVGVPADGRGIKENISSLQGGQARAFGIPLVPADQRSHAAIFSIEGLEAEIARSEVKLLVIKRIVRNVHLAIEAFGAAVGVKNDCGVVVEAARATLKNRDYDCSFCFAGDSGQRFRRGAGNGLSQIEERSIFTLAEILCAEKLRQADHLRALFGGSADFLHRATNIVVGIGRAVHLDQAYGK